MTARPSQGRGKFPSTNFWSLLEGVGAATPEQKHRVLDLVARRYWSPIYHYVLRQGYSPVDAEDLVQEFFAFAFRTELFGKADRTRGRFRSFVIAALNNFIANERRRSFAAKRSPEGGAVSIDEMSEEGRPAPRALMDRMTPEIAFHEMWVRNTVANVLADLETQFEESGKRTHFQLFRARVIAPALDGEPPGSLADQAGALGLEYKEAANQIETAKRAFRRLLEREVRAYANSPDEASDEAVDVLGFLAWEEAA